MSETVNEPASETALPKTDDGASSPGEPIRKLAKAMLRAVLLSGGVTAVIAMIVFVILLGTSGLLGSLVGGVVILVASLLTIVIMYKTADLPPAFVMVAALGGYLGKIIILFGVLMALRGVEALHSQAMALTMLSIIIVSVAAEVFAYRRVKIPIITLTQSQ